MPPQSKPYLPRYIPVMHAYERILQYADEYGANDIQNFSSLRKFERMLGDEVVKVKNLKQFFKTDEAFKTFKSIYIYPVTPENWVHVIDKYRDARRKSRSVSPKPNNRKRLKLKTFVGSPRMSEVSSDESVLSIDPSNDECDDTNVNFPKPVCQGIRRVCRYYDRARRYKPYQKDDSEKHRYKMKLLYE